MIDIQREKVNNAYAYFSNINSGKPVNARAFMAFLYSIDKKISLNLNWMIFKSGPFNMDLFSWIRNKEGAN